MPPARRLSAPQRRASVLLAFATATAVTLLLHRQVFAGLVPSKLPTMYDNDQLGYLAIVTNVAHGHAAALEPDTLSGINPYPSGYYTAVGLVARVLGIAPVTAWNSVSLLLQIIAFGTLGVSIAVVSRRPWAAVVGPLVMITGCGAWLQTGAWLLPINHQGALWGPFGVLFPQNGETAALCAIVTGMALLGLALGRPQIPVNLRRLLILAACACAGAAANFQTYGFLTGAYVVSAAVAASALWHWRAARAAVASLVLLLVVVLVGPVVAGVGGTLAALVFGLIPMIPGAVVLVRRIGPAVIAYPLAYAACAAPMILSTLAVRDTPFMKYRVSSNIALGVTSWPTVGASAPLLLLMIAVAVAGIRRGDAIAAGIGTSFPIAWPLVALNDLWGANAEPYRFWIDAHLLGLVLLVLALARLSRPATAIASARRAAKAWDPGTRGAHLRREAPESLPAPTRGRRRPPVALIAVAALLWAMSLGDVSSYLRDTNIADTWDPGSESSQQIIAAAGEISPADGRLWSTACLDSRRVKILTGAPVARYHLGMAWPDDREAVDRAMQASDARSIDPEVLRAAQVRWVLTADTCDPALQAPFEKVRTVGDVTLWELSG